MDRSCLQQKQFTLRSASESCGGFTILELLVSLGLGAVVLAIALASILSSKTLFTKDLTRTSLNQNLRSAMDLMGTTIREAGENLNANFPALELVNGTSGAQDELIIRRNLLDEVLTLCTPITSSSGVDEVYFGDATTTPGCSRADNLFNYNSWAAARAERGGTMTAYIYNFATRQGEFFDVVDEDDTGSELYLERGSGNWQFNYTVGTTGVFLIEEWRVSVASGLLQLFQNGDTLNPLNVAADINQFQISIIMTNGTTLTAFDRDDGWSNIRAVDLTLGTTSPNPNQPMTKVSRARYFIRNILST